MTFIAHSLPDAIRYTRMTTSELRDSFLLSNLFVDGEVNLVWDVSLDRVVVGAACPADEPLLLSCPEELRATYFCERRELGMINLGGSGLVTVDSQDFNLQKHDALYVGKGSKSLQFQSNDPQQPARYYLISYPAHASYPTTWIKKEMANCVNLGCEKEANQRTIWQYIHENGAKSCQLVMGWTEIAPGSVWNTMPPHTHDRRSEVYLYFNIPDEHRVLHLMGSPQETRPLWVNSEEAVLSPPWSIHCGCGTSEYSFVWAMGGENQTFDDMDRVLISELR